MTTQVDDVAVNAAQHRRNERRGLVLGVIGVVIFGLTFPFTRMAVLEMEPLFVALGRAVLAAVFAGAVLLITRTPFVERRLWGGLARYSLGVVLGFPLFATLAMKVAPAAHAGVIAAVLPLATAMASVVVAGERPSKGFWACGVAGSAAVLVYAFIHGGPMHCCSQRSSARRSAMPKAASSLAALAAGRRSPGRWSSRRRSCWH
jgi:drug/metabolite transporter (DMT)-like permease